MPTPYEIIAETFKRNGYDTGMIDHWDSFRDCIYVELVDGSWFEIFYTCGIKAQSK